MKIEPIIEFLKVIEKFKTCERVCQTTSAGRAESDAEHSWHLSVFLILLEKEFENVDFVKILKMALIHDLPEIYAGDTNPYRGNTINKVEQEKNAAKKLFSILPDPEAQNLSSLFDAYIEQKSLESQIVKSADKLMPLIQNLCTNAHHSSYRKLDVEYREVLEYMNKFFSGGVLQKFYSKLLSEAHDSGVFSTAKKKG